MWLIDVKEAADQILHVEVFGSSNRVKKKGYGVTSRLHRAGLSMKVLSHPGQRHSKFCDIDKWTCFPGTSVLHSGRIVATCKRPVQITSAPYLNPLSHKHNTCI